MGERAHPTSPRGTDVREPAALTERGTFGAAHADHDPWSNSQLYEINPANVHIILSETINFIFHYQRSRLKILRKPEAPKVVMANVHIAGVMEQMKAEAGMKRHSTQQIHQSGRRDIRGIVLENSPLISWRQIGTQNALKRSKMSSKRWKTARRRLENFGIFDNYGESPLISWGVGNNGESSITMLLIFTNLGKIANHTVHFSNWLEVQVPLRNKYGIDLHWAPVQSPERVMELQFWFLF